MWFQRAYSTDLTAAAAGEMHRTHTTVTCLLICLSTEAKGTPTALSYAPPQIACGKNKTSVQRFFLGAALVMSWRGDA